MIILNCNRVCVCVCVCSIIPCDWQWMNEKSSEEKLKLIKCVFTVHHWFDVWKFVREMSNKSKQLVNVSSSLTFQWAALCARTYTFAHIQTSFMPGFGETIKLKNYRWARTDAMRWYCSGANQWCVYEADWLLALKPRILRIWYERIRPNVLYICIIDCYFNFYHLHRHRHHSYLSRLELFDLHFGIGSRWVGLKRQWCAHKCMNLKIHRRSQTDI